MDKTKLLELFIELSKSAVPTRDQFIAAAGISKRKIQELFGSYNGLKDAVLARLDNFTPELSDDFDPDENYANYPLESAQTLDELIQVCNIDTSQWTPIKVNAGSANGKNSVRAEFKRISGISSEELLKHFIEKSAEYSPPAPLITSKPIGDFMYFISMTDLHLGSIISNEHGEYNPEIAKECYFGALADLMDKLHYYKNNLERIVLLIGSDFFHTDVKSTTTKGTYVEADPRNTKTFLLGCDLMVEVISLIAEHFNVTLLYVPGNHAKMTEFFLAQYLKSWFRNNPRVEIDADNSPRKYLGWGSTLLGITHGDNVKLDNLSMIMVKENQSTISNYKYLEWATGHRHGCNEKEQFGVKIRVLPALCPPDDWHSSKGFIGNLRSAQGFLYSKSDGLEATFYSKPL